MGFAAGFDGRSGKTEDLASRKTYTNIQGLMDMFMSLSLFGREIVRGAEEPWDPSSDVTPFGLLGYRREETSGTTSSWSLPLDSLTPRT